MFIYIPTHKRPMKQRAFTAIPKKLLPRTRLVVTREDYQTYAKQWGKAAIVVCPVEGIAPKRQWILENSESPYCLMIDDDIRFNVREPGITKTHMMQDKEFLLMYRHIKCILQRGFCAVGISQRAGNNRVPESFRKSTRMHAVYAFDTEKILSYDLRFDRLPVMEDFDMTLQIIAAGLENVVLYDYCWEQVSGTTGGCAAFRTKAVQKEAAFELARLHPGLVKPVVKTSSKQGAGVFTGKRWDVRIQWQKAVERQWTRQHKQGFLDA